MDTELDKQMLKIEVEKLAIEKEKLYRERNLIYRHFSAFSTIISAVIVAFVSLTAVSAYEKQLSAEIAKRKLSASMVYMKVVNKSWAQYVTSSQVDNDLRQKGIDAFEELRLISSSSMVSNLTRVNSYFSKLYPPFEITPKMTEAFGLEFNRLKESARREFVSLH